MAEDNHGRDALLGVFVGAVAGFVAGVLFAPKSGKETREDLKQGAEKAWTFTTEKVHQAQDELEGLLVKAKTLVQTANAKTRREVSELIDKAKKAQRLSRDVARAFKDGRADDEDLNMAVKEASEARQHLKDFLAHQS